MSELQAYYEAFGYCPRTKEAPDHITVELGFLAYLNMKEAFAQASGDKKQRVVTAEADKRFAADHLARIVPPLAEGLGSRAWDIWLKLLGFFNGASVRPRNVRRPQSKPACLS